jgi:hypothetical protein
MPRNSTLPVITIALTASGAARALSLGGTEGTALIKNAVLMGELDCRQLGIRKLIPVFGPLGLQEWFLKLPKAKRGKSHA